MRHLFAKVDWESYLASHVSILNADGRRGYERGVRTFDCPLCGDTKERGFVNVEWYSAGCFNSGCAAEPRLAGLLEWARIMEGEASGAEVLAKLIQRFPSYGLPDRAPPLLIREYDDWVKLPGTLVNGHPVTWDRKFINFAERQWGLSRAPLREAGVRFCMQGKHRNRIVFPIRMFGQDVGFQARAIYECANKYMTSRRGDREEEQAECGRAAEAMLWGWDDIHRGRIAVMVEGIADAIQYNWMHKAGNRGTAFAIMGVALTSEKLSLIAERQPQGVVVALDNDAIGRALSYVEQLRSWGVNCKLGKWYGGKDAGSGAELRVSEATQADIVEARVKGTLRR